MHYFFDLRDQNRFVKDEEGKEIASFDIAKMEAAERLTNYVKDIQQERVKRKTSIEVRTGANIVFTFRIVVEASR